MKEGTTESVKTVKSNEIDYMVIINRLWAERKVIIITTVVGIVLGLIIAIISPKEFKVVTTMLPQSESESGLGKFSSLAAIAGFDLNLGQSGTEISPVIYPQIVESETFLDELMKEKYKFSKVDQPVSYYDYYLKIKKPSLFEYLYGYTVGLPGLIKMKMRKDVPVTKKAENEINSYSRDESDMMLSMKGRLKLVINKKEGYLTLTCVMPEALLAAQVAKKAQTLLQKTITEYKVKGAEEQLAFVEQRYREKKAEFEKAQQRLAWFRDRNQNVSTAVAKTELDKLQSEYDIAYSVYSELAKLQEQTKLQVKKRTPVFTIIKPVVVPIDKDKPKRTTILMIWTVLGFVGGIGFVFGKEYYKYFKKKTFQKV